MKNFIDKNNILSFLQRYILPKNKYVFYLSIILCITLPAIVCRLLYNKIFDGLPVYDDLVAGDTTWSGYNIKGNLVFIYCYLAFLLLSIFVIPFVLNFILRRNVSDDDKKDTENLHTVSLFFIGVLSFCITLFVFTRTIPFYMALVFVLAYIIYLLLSTNKTYDSTSIFTKLCLLGVYLYFDMIAAFTIINIALKKGITLYDSLNNYAIMSIMLLVFILAKMFSRSKVKEITIDRILILSQIFLPAIILSFYRFFYMYNGDKVAPFHSQKLKYVCLFVSLLMISFNVYRYYQFEKKIKPLKLILSTTAISIIAFIAFASPSGSLLTDFFHVGELTTPMHQLVEFGLLPYLDYYPIHGLLDYFNQSVNYLFFSGEYATYAAAGVIGNVIKAVILCVTVRYFVKNEVLPFILTVLCVNAGVYNDRIFGVFLFLIVLYNAKSKKDMVTYIWWWIVASVFAVFWNPPLGGSAVISSIPFVIFSFLHEGGLKSLDNLNTRKYRNRVLLFWVPLIMLCLFLVPFAYNMVVYTLDNARSTLLANGSAANILNGSIKIFNNQMADSVFTLIILPFGFTLPVGLLFLFSYKNRSLAMPVTITVLQILLLVAFIANYTFVRADGSINRAITANRVITAAVLIALSSQVLIKPRKVNIIIYAVIMGITLSGNAHNLFSQHKKVIAFPKIDSNYILFDGKQAGINNLGIVYAPQNSVEWLVAINELLQDEPSFLNLANYVALDAIFNKPSAVPYSSIYNINNKNLHQKSLDKIVSRPPTLALVGNDYILRAYPIYRWLTVNGYMPYKYKNIIFLLPPDSIRTKYYETANNEYYNAMHTKHLGFLPILWGSEEICNTRISATDIITRIVGSNHINHQEFQEVITGNDSFIVYQTEMPIEGIKNDFIKVTLQSEYDLIKESEFQLFWSDEGEDFSEEKSYVFKGRAGTLLIPVGASPYWALSNRVQNIRFDFPISMEGKTAPNVTIEIMYYNEK